MLPILQSIINKAFGRSVYFGDTLCRHLLPSYVLHSVSLSSFHVFVKMFSNWLLMAAESQKEKGCRVFPSMSTPNSLILKATRYLSNLGRADALLTLFPYCAWNSIYSLKCQSYPVTDPLVIEFFQLLRPSYNSVYILKKLSNVEISTLLLVEFNCVYFLL